MSDKLRIFDTGVSAVARAKKRDSLRRQRVAIIAMILVVAALLAALSVALYWIDILVYEDVDGAEYYVKRVEGKYSLCYKSGEILDRNDDGYYQTDAGTLVFVDASSGSCTRYAVVDLEDTEAVGYSEYVLMFKQLTYDISSTKDMSKVIKSIEVHNEYGEYSFVREGNGDFYIEGSESTPYNKETFARLAVACGYTLSMRRLEDPKKQDNGEIDFAEYGLAVTVDEDGNEKEPAYYIITTMTGESHKVIVGDLTVTGTGYYARYEGRDTIYILVASGMTETVLGRVEDIVTPMIVYPMDMNNYFNVAEFTIYNSIDYDAIYDELREIYGDDVTAEDIDSKDFSEKYAEAFEKHSKKACCFNYVDADTRKNTMYSATPYFSALEYTAGYYINGNNIDTVLYNLYDTQFMRVEVLSPTEDELVAYGLDEAPYMLSYFYLTKNSDGEDVYVYNVVEFSEKTEDGIYYAYSGNYDMIVSISEASLDFLLWEEIDWYDSSYIQLDISHITDIMIESPEYSAHFEIDDSASRYMTYVEQSGSKITSGDKTYYVVKDPLTGKYGLKCDDKFVGATYRGDYLVTPLVYSKGEAQSESFLFHESREVDTDSDGTNDAYLYYFYNVTYTENGYCLVAQAFIADDEGNKLTETQTMLGSPYQTTDYFVTKSSYLYLTDRDSYIGRELDAKYAKANRGEWGRGNLFVTSQGQYVLVNVTTGEWCLLDDISCGIHFADSETSRLALRAIEIPTLYNANGSVKRYGETYYPMTENKLLYDEESGMMQVYDYKNKIWENVTYDDCTIGVWNTGAYYVTDAGTIIVVNENTGDYGVATLSSIENYVAEIIADGVLLDYNIRTTNHVGNATISSATDNFKQFYKGLLYASIEGTAELSDEEKASLAALDNFDEAGENNPCQLKITVIADDFKGNRRDIVYRFYQYTERKSYMTIEVLSSPDTTTSDSTKGYGGFYVLRTFADKIIEDARKVVEEKEVTAITKY